MIGLVFRSTFWRTVGFPRAAVGVNILAMKPRDNQVWRLAGQAFQFIGDAAGEPVGVVVGTGDEA